VRILVDKKKLHYKVLEARSTSKPDVKVTPTYKVAEENLLKVKERHHSKKESMSLRAIERSSEESEEAVDGALHAKESIRSKSIKKSKSKSPPRIKSRRGKAWK
jgi:Flp pilus assembly protein CpaB